MTTIHLDPWRGLLSGKEVKLGTVWTSPTNVTHTRVAQTLPISITFMTLIETRTTSWCRTIIQFCEFLPIWDTLGACSCCSGCCCRGCRGCCSCRGGCSRGGCCCSGCCSSCCCGCCRCGCCCCCCGCGCRRCCCCGCCCSCRSGCRRGGCRRCGCCCGCCCAIFYPGHTSAPTARLVLSARALAISTGWTCILG